jgi:hypothetical protein
VRWLTRAAWPSAVGKLDLAVMSAAFGIFGLSLIFQGHRWHSTPAYHVLLLILPAGMWGGLFLLSGASMGAAAWQFSRRWAVITSLVLAFALTAAWAIAFVLRYLTSPNTTPETWVSWAVFLFLLLKVAVSIDRSPAIPPPGAELADFRQAIDDMLTAAEEGQRASLTRALAEGSQQRRDALSAALGAYGEALRAIVPAGATPVTGDLAQQAIAEARKALRRAEEAYERATGRTAGHPDVP